ncbi:MAG: hypothetical protein AAF985_13970 [Bacteroidota bacterium]
MTRFFTDPFDFTISENTRSQDFNPCNCMLLAISLPSRMMLARLRTVPGDHRFA